MGVVPANAHDGGSHGGRSAGKIAVLVEILGIDEEALLAALDAGSSVADIATEQGVDVQTVVDAVVTYVVERAAEAGKTIDTEAVTAKVTAKVNGEHRKSHRSRSGHRGRGGHGGGSGHGGWRGR